MSVRHALAAAAALLAALPLAATAGTTPSQQAGTTRIAGADRYATSAAVAGWAFAPTVDAVFVTSGTQFPDALGAGTAAARVGAPLLVVNATTVPAPVAARLAALRPRAIYLVGGTGVVSTAVEQALRAYGPVQRIAGTDRYGTASAVSRSFAAPTGGTVYLGSGEAFPDAMAGGPAAAKHKAPMLLTSASVLPRATRDEIVRAAPSRVVILGGGISDAVVDQVHSAAPNATVVRRAGADRYLTARAIATYAWPNGSAKVLVASGTDFADGLSAAPAARVNDAPLLLTTPRCVPHSTAPGMRLFGTRLAAYVGSPAVASDAVCMPSPDGPPTPAPTTTPTPVPVSIATPTPTFASS